MKIEVKPAVDHSFESLNSEVIYISSLCGFFNVKSISVIRSISRVLCEMIYRFLLLTSSRTLSVSGLRKFISRQMLYHTVPWRSQELYFAKWLIKHRFI